MMLIHVPERMLIEPTVYLYLIRFSLRKMRAGYYLSLVGSMCSNAASLPAWGHFAMHCFLFIRRRATSYAIQRRCQRSAAHFSHPFLCVKLGAASGV